MKFLSLCIRYVDLLNEKIGILVSWLTAALVLVVSYDVVTRYILKTSSVAVQELEWHLFAIVFLIGAAFTLKEERHVRVDVFYQRLSSKQKAFINLTGSIFFLIPFAFIIIGTSMDFVLNAFLIGESSPDPGGLPARYLLKACIPLAFILLLLQSFSLAFKSILILTRKETHLPEK